LPRVGIYNIWNNDSKWWDNINTTDKIEKMDDIIYHSYIETINELSATYGSEVNNWRWGDAHKLTLKHPLGSVAILDKLFGLNKGDFEVPGSYHTTSPYGYKFTSPFAVSHGASQRHIYVVGDWDKSITVIPTGNSGNPGSKYYANQTDLFISNEYHPDWFSKEKVVENAKYISVFSPN
jgi:penicillin amidase